MAQLPTGTVTFLFSDIEGSTKLLQRLGDDYARVLGEHQALLRAAFAAHGGMEVDTQGDAFFVAFPTAPAAVAAAAEATRALAEHVWPEDATLLVRMGLHTGTPQLVGDHYVGLDVHRAARIAAAGHGGQVLLSQTTCELVAQTLPTSVTLRELGLYRLKDLQQPERLSQLVLPGLPDAFPPPRTLDLRPHNLPVQPTPLLDRGESLAALCELLRRTEVRLVTLSGPGGIGKTRLAVQVAAELVEAFADGVWFVRLSRLVDPALVVPTIAQTLGLQERGSQLIAELLRAHVADKRLLLVLDNFEQVVGAAGEVAGLLAASPGLHVLVTSRSRLHLRGEREYPLAPLPLPELPEVGRLPPERLSQYAAVALFVERAGEARPDFAVTAANAPAIAEICARLDGLPLAIELAAARIKVLPPEALLARLSSQLKVLTGGARDLEERQQTMRATIAWSEGLLSLEERVVFWRLAVFVGGCTLEAAEAICTSPAGAEPLGLYLLDGLSTLVDQGLVQQREEGGEPRFGMLQVIREYALERLEASGEAEALRRSHAAHYLALAERAEPELTGSAAGAWLGRLEGEHDNLRAALGWARERGAAETGLGLVAAVWRFWWTRGHAREGLAWAEGLLAPESAPPAMDGVAFGEATARSGGSATDPAGTSPGAARVRARALHAGGSLALARGELAQAERWLEQARALAHAADDPRTEARALVNLGVLARYRADWTRAADVNTEALALYRQLGDREGVATVLNNLGVVASRQGDLEGAADAFTEALALYRQEGRRVSIALVLGNLGAVAWRRGELAEAEALEREALAMAWDLGDVRRCAEELEQLVRTAGAAGEGERAARLLGAAAALREALGVPLPTVDQTEVEQAVATVRAALGEEAWAAAFAAGQALSLEQAIAEALGESSESERLRA